jgi:pyruvate-formate lyase
MIEEGNVAVRTMGRFDELYVDFYRRDRARGMSRDEAKNLIKFFWTAFYAKHQGTRFGKNFCFGPDFNELSHLGMETYHELDTVDPKLSVLFRKDMPQDFLECYARNIRDGRTGIVTLNYDVVVEGLVRHGRLREDAEDFIPIGCYEPAVAGKEVGLSGCTLLLLPQVLVHLLGLGEDHGTFDALFARYLDHIDETCRELQSRQLLCDAAWKYVNPVPLLSSTFESCVEKGRDVSDAGAVYNTTGNVACHIADAVDSLCAIRCLVYERRQCTLDELREAVASDWRGHEALRCMALKVPPKWGNDDDAADALGVAIAERVSKTLSALENGRGGRFFPSLYGQGVTETGARLGAFPSGRNAGEPVSKNMDAVIGMDRNGITSLMNSVLKIDMTQFPCGTCLDIMLHPGSVRGDRGVRTIADLIRIFVTRGGSGIQFNIFDADVLRDAQRRPENHDGLQVRVCGWNAKFTGLTTAAQNTFIREAEKHG